MQEDEQQCLKSYPYKLYISVLGYTIIRRKVDCLNNLLHQATTPCTIENPSSFPRVHHQRDVVPFKKDPPQSLSAFLLYIDFLSILQNQIHVLVKPNNTPFNPQVLLLKQPYLDPSFTLKEPKDEIDGLCHDPLDFGGRHGCCYRRPQSLLLQKTLKAKTLDAAISDIWEIFLHWFFLVEVATILFLCAGLEVIS